MKSSLWYQAMNIEDLIDRFGGEHMSKETEKHDELGSVEEAYNDTIREFFTERELGLMRNCIMYADNKPSGLPGHNLMILVSKLCDFSGVYPPEQEGES